MCSASESDSAATHGKVAAFAPAAVMMVATSCHAAVGIIFESWWRWRRERDGVRMLPWNARCVEPSPRGGCPEAAHTANHLSKTPTLPIYDAGDRDSRVCVSRLRSTTCATLLA